MHTRYSSVLAGIRDTGKLPEGDVLADAVREFHDAFDVAKADAAEAAAEVAAEAAAAEALNPETTASA